jgi:hypothetical protein
MSEANLIGRLSIIILFLITGSASAYMLTHLEREAQRVLDGARYWYGEKKGWDEAHELRKIRRNITILYTVCLIISIVMCVLLSLKLAKVVGWL